MKPGKDIKKEFPIFTIHPNLVYLDSTATALKPKRVIDKLSEYYTQYSANIFRGVYDMSEIATQEYEETRDRVAQFIHASSPSEIVFTRGTTESINLFVNGIRDTLHHGDEIVTTIFEHHSNFVPWQQLAAEKNIRLTVVDEIEHVVEKVTPHTKILALTHVSNVMGTIHPIQDVITAIRKKHPHVVILIDGAQAVPHMRVDVYELDIDAYAFSGHKMLGPTGVGVLWVQKKLLEKLKPYQYGGEMIRSVSVGKTEFADLPHRFEAGTPAIAEVIALKEAIRFLESVGLEAIHTYEKHLAQLCYSRLQSEFGNRISCIGPAERESGVVAFTVRDIHAHDVAQLLNEDGIAVRAGHHCAMPLHTHLGIDASVRASFYLYNTPEDIESLITSLKRIVRTMVQ